MLIVGRTVVTCGLVILVVGASASSASQPLEIPLWEGTPYGSETFEGEETYHQKPDTSQPDRWLTGVTKPIVSVYRPSAERSTGGAVAIFPGGGYAGLAIDKEGHDIARWFAERGMVGAVVPYRCGGDPHLHPTPRRDARRSLQLLRSRAAEWGIDPHKVGVIGFSAGGHLAATAATQWIEGDASAPDLINRQTSRPDFALLIYPVISLRDGIGHLGSRKNLIGEEYTHAYDADLSADEMLRIDSPPAFLVHAADDAAVADLNSLRYYQACKKLGVPVELHLYEKGGHGFGMQQGPNWAPAMEAWLAGRGLAKPLD